jgi:putative transcriptional regulator
MSSIKSIRERLGVTQESLAKAIGCTQGNVWHYEHGQAVPSDAAKKLIAYAATLGHVVTYDEIYGPVEPQKPARKGKAATRVSAAPTANGKPKKQRRDGPNKLATGKPSNRKGS